MTAPEMPEVGQRLLVTTQPGTYWSEAHEQWVRVERGNGDGTVDVRVVHDFAEPSEDGTAWTMFPGDGPWRPEPACPECGPACADVVNEAVAVAS